MDIHHKLALWLHCNKKDYEMGLELLTKLGISSESFFNVTSPTKLHYSLLYRALAGYAIRMNIKPRASNSPNKIASTCISDSNTKQLTTEILQVKIQRPKIDRNPSVRYEDLPANLQVLYDENGRMAREMKSLHAELKAIKDLPDQRQKRGQLARELVQRSHKSRENWEAVDSWWAEHQAPQDPSALAARQALEKDRRIKANLNYIRRFYGKPKNMPEVEIRMKELDKWGVSYEELVRKVSGAH